MDNPEVVKQFEDYFSLFAQPGWKLLIEDLEGMIENLDSLEYVDTMEKLHFNKGQLTILKRIHGMKNAMEAAYEDYMNSEAE